MIRVSEIEALEKVSGQVEGMHTELSIVAKKSPNDAINKFKLKLLNQVLEAANEVLGEEYEPIEGFEKFEEDDIPTSSDAVFVLNQYIAEIERMRADNTFGYAGNWYYRLDSDDPESCDEKGELLKIRAYTPKKVRK